MRWKLLMCVLLGLLTACGPGQTPVPTNPSLGGTLIAPPGGSVEGSVVAACRLVGDDCDEEDFFVVEIEARGGEAPFRFDDLPRGSYLVAAVKDTNLDGLLGEGDYAAEFQGPIQPPATGIRLQMEVLGGEPPPPPPPPPEGIEPGIVKGRVVGSDGRPLVGAEIVADNTLFHNSNVSGYTDADGRYRLDVSQPVGTWAMTGKVTFAYDGQTFTVALEPEDPSLFAGVDGAVRDFSLSLRSVSGPALIMSGLGDYTPYEEIEITLEPVGPIVDGSDGETIVSGLRPIGDGWAVTGVPFGRYRVTARHVPSGETMLVSRPLTQTQDYIWAESYTTGFSSMGLGIYQLRAEVRRSCDWPCE